LDIRPFDLPDAADGTKQSIRLHYRPSHGQVKLIEKLTRKAVADESYLSGEDALIAALADGWTIKDDAGEIPFGTANIDRIEHAVSSLIRDECLRITEATQPNSYAKIIEDARGLSRALMDAKPPDGDMPKVDALSAALLTFIGGAPPNR